VRDVATKAPMTPDTIFRLYSMSKPITAVAAMTLIEEGKLSLADPLSKYIPAFADVEGGCPARRRRRQAALDLVAPDRPILIQDLMRHSSGIVYDYVVFGLIKQEHIDADISPAISTMRNWRSGSPGSRWPISRERPGPMAIRSTCWRG